MSFANSGWRAPGEAERLDAQRELAARANGAEVARALDAAKWRALQPYIADLRASVRVATGSTELRGAMGAHRNGELRTLLDAIDSACAIGNVPSP